MRAKIKLVVFDAYGVVLTGGYPDTSKFLAKKFKRDWREIYRILYTKYFNMAAEKKITQQAAWERAVKESRLPVSIAQIKKIHYNLMGVNEKTARLAGKIKKGRRILLLSKNTRSQFRDVNEMFPILRRVFGKNIINTWEYDLPKASRATMELICRRFGVKPEEVVVTDDQAANLEAPKELGARVALYKNFAQFRKELMRILRESA